MPSRSTHSHWRATVPCALLLAVVYDPSSLHAAPSGSRDSGLVPQARQQIRIAVSVRPTMSIRQQKTAVGHQGAFCVWSNTSTQQYDVRAELRRTGSEPVELRWNEMATADGSDCPNSKALLARLNPGDENSSGVLTLLISPQ
jgi:hypothetical protein